MTLAVGGFRWTLAMVAVATACSTPPAKAPIQASKSVDVQGHRGARARYPESTLPAFEYAIRIGVDTLECDVVVTRDDQLVVTHDYLIDDVICQNGDGTRLTQRPAIRSLTLAQVKSYDCGTLKHPRFPDQTPVPGARIPLLSEVFDLAARSPRPIKFNIEPKSFPAHPEWTLPPGEFARRVVDEVRRHGLVSRVTVEAFDYRVLAAVRRLEPGITLSALIKDTLPNLAVLAGTVHADIVSPAADWITEDDVRSLHEHGVRVVAWGADTEEQWAYLTRIGVDGMMCDDPEPLLGFLRTRGRHER